MVTQEQPSFRAELERWHDLIVRRRQLSQQISRHEARLAELRDRLSPSGILGAFRSQLQINGDIRPAGGHGDKVYSLVAGTEDKIEAVQLSIALLRAQLQDVEETIGAIEAELPIWSAAHRLAAEWINRDGRTWQEVSDELHLSKSRVYELLAELVDGVDRWRRW